MNTNCSLFFVLSQQFYRKKSYMYFFGGFSLKMCWSCVCWHFPTLSRNSFGFYFQFNISTLINSFSSFLRTVNVVTQHAMESKTEKNGIMLKTLIWCEQFTTPIWCEQSTNVIYLSLWNLSQSEKRCIWIECFRVKKWLTLSYLHCILIFNVSIRPKHVVITAKRSFSISLSVCVSVLILW